MGEQRWRGLGPVQTDGLECVVCAASFRRPGSVSEPVGRSDTGSQVFACQGRCLAVARAPGAPDARRLTFWRDNRRDGEFSLPLTEVAALFAASPWAEVAWRLDRKLRAFLTDPECAVSAVWDDHAGYAALVELVGTAGRGEGAGGT